MQFREPSDEDQRLGRVAVHPMVPAAQPGQDFRGLSILRPDTLEHQRQQIAGGQRDRVRQHRLMAGDGAAVVVVQHLDDPLRAVGLVEAAGDQVGIVGGRPRRCWR